MKEIKNILERLNNIKVGAPGSLLVFETDGFLLYGVLAHAGVTALEFEAVGQSRATEFSTAVGEVLEQLRSQVRKRLPKKAALITPSAVVALLDLPVNPEKPRPKAQMSELVRWELEPIFAQQNEIWSIGALLMGRGYIDAAQRREIVTELELRGGSGAGRSTVRFGEAALDLGFATREQIDECLALQEGLVLFDDEVVSGWSPQAVTQEEEREQFSWLAVGVGDAMRKQWVAAFRRHGVFLRWIYPQLGTAFAAVEPVSDERDQMLVDIRQEQFVVARGWPGGLTSLRVASCRDGQANPDECAGLCHEQMRPDINKVHLAVADKLYEMISSGVERRVEREITAVPLPGKMPAATEQTPKQILASLAGAAAHALGHGDANTLPRVEAQPPKPPLYKRKELWPYAAAGVVLLAVSGFDLSLRYETWQNRQELARLDDEYKDKLRLKKLTESTASEAKNLQQQEVDKQALLEKTRHETRILGEVIMRRQSLVPGLLRAVGDAASDEVLLDSIEEGARQSGFHLVGWSLTDTGGQLFLNRLNKTLIPWNYRVSDAQIRSGEGRLGIQGYTLDIWLSPVNGVGGSRG